MKLKKKLIYYFHLSHLNSFLFHFQVNIWFVIGSLMVASFRFCYCGWWIVQRVTVGEYGLTYGQTIEWKIFHIYSQPLDGWMDE